MFLKVKTQFACLWLLPWKYTGARRNESGAEPVGDTIRARRHEMLLWLHQEPFFRVSPFQCISRVTLVILPPTRFTFNFFPNVPPFLFAVCH